MSLRKTVTGTRRWVLLLAALPLAVPAFGASAARPGASSVAAGCPQIAPDAAIRVRLLQDIDSSKSKVGDTFAARLENPLLEKGKTVAAPGSTARVRLVRLLEPKGSGEPPFLALQLADLTVEGRACPIVTGFAEVGAGILKVTRGPMPEGTTSAEVILDTLTEDNPLGPSDAAIVDGAGVSFAVVSGQRVKVPRDVVLRFRIADTLVLGPEKTF